MKDNQFIKEYFESKKRVPTILEEATLSVVSDELERTSPFSAEILDVKLPENALHLLGAYGLYSRLYQELGEEKITLNNLATLCERRQASLLKKKNYVVSEDVAWTVPREEGEREEVSFVATLASGERGRLDAVERLNGRRVFAHQLYTAVTSGDLSRAENADAVKKLVECDEDEQVTGLSHVLRVDPTGRADSLAHKFVLGIGSAPSGQISKKKLRAGDEIYLIRTEGSRAYSAREMQVLMKTPKLARPMMVLFSLAENPAVVLLAGLELGYDLVLDEAIGAGVIEDGLFLTERREGLYLATVRTGDVTEWLENMNEVGLEPVRIGAYNEDGRITVSNGGNRELELDLSALAHICRPQRVKLELLSEMGADLGKTDALTAIYTEKGDFINGAKCELSRPGVCSTKGVCELADSVNGGNSLLISYGGKLGLTPSLVHAVNASGAGDNTSVIAHSSYPRLSRQFPYVSTINAIALAVIKQMVSGVELGDVRLKIGVTVPDKIDENAHGKLFSAYLGAMSASARLGVSTCGTPEISRGGDVSVTAFSIGNARKENVLGNIFNEEGRVYRISLPRDEFGVPDFEHVLKLDSALKDARRNGAKVTATVATESDSAVTAIIKSCLGSGLGFSFPKPSEKLFAGASGDVFLSCSDIKYFTGLGVEFIGEVQSGVSFEFGTKVLNTFGATQSYTAPYEKNFRTIAPNMRGMVENVRFKTAKESKCINPVRPRIFIPVYKGSYGEYELAESFREVGAIPILFKLRGEVDDLADAMLETLNRCQIIAIPDGYLSSEVEKSVLGAFRNKKVKDGVKELLTVREGLAIGSGTGYGILAKLGLLSGDEISDRSDIILAPGNVGRRLVTTAKVKVVSTLSPWFYGVEPGEVYNLNVNVSGSRLTLDAEKLDELEKTGRIATQFVDGEGFATMESPYNPNGSDMAIEGVFSPSGRTYARAGRIEKPSKSYRNLDGEWDMKLFESAMKYFK